MRVRWGYVRDAVAFLASVYLAHDLDARQLGATAWVGTMLGSIATLYLVISLNELPGTAGRTLKQRIVETVVGGTFMSLFVLLPNLFLAGFVPIAHPDYAELKTLPFWKAFPLAIWRPLAAHSLLVFTIALEQVFRIRDGVKNSGDRSYYVTQAFAEFMRFLLLSFLLGILHALHAPSIALVLTLVVLYIPAQIFHRTLES